MIAPPGPEALVYSPTEINQAVKHHIEAGFGRVWIQGEISNLATPASGHQYFSLKDANAQIRCALFRPQASQLTQALKNGDEVLVRGQLSLYAPRGDYQLIADAVLSAGLGALHAQFERLKQQLSQEGLFDADRKKPLPKWPKTIAVVSSQTGAALQDIQNTLTRRWPIAQVAVYPALVQGSDAPASLIKALLQADQQPATDLIILARGGGSLEDLWAFNDEALARAISELSRPVITGIGHETDTTIADYVADYRSATPTQAAVMATPDETQWRDFLNQMLTRLHTQTTQRLNQHAQALDLAESRLSRMHPARQLDEGQRRLDEHQRRLYQVVPKTLDRCFERLGGYARMLNQLSPLAVLDRGYAIVQDQQNRMLTSKNPPIKGMDINILLDSFEVESKITDVRPSPHSAQSD